MNLSGIKSNNTGITPFSEESEISHTPINDLPDEILLKIFSSLELRTLGNSSLTCKRWNALSFDYSLLQNIFFKSLPQRAELYKKRKPEVPDNDFILRSLKSDARMRSAKVQPSSRELIRDRGITSLQVADGKVFSGSYDETIRIWELDSGKELKSLEGHTGWVNCLQVADGKVFSGSTDETIRIWDIDSGKELIMLEGHTNWVSCLQVADGKVFSGSFDKTIRIWDIDSGQELKALNGHVLGVTCLQVAEGKVFSGSQDKTIRIWDLVSGEELKVIDNPNESLNNLIVVDGKIFVQSGYDKIKVFDFNHPQNLSQ